MQHELLHPFRAPEPTFDRAQLVSLWLFAAWAIATGATAVGFFLLA